MAQILKYLRPYHYEVMQMRLKGHSYRDIAETFNKSEQTIKVWFSQCDLFRETYKQLEEERQYKIMEKFHAAVDDVQDELIRIALKGRYEKDRLVAIKEILDRALGGINQKQQIDLKGEMHNTNEQTIDESLLNDPEVVEALKKIFEKQSDVNE